MIPCKRVLNALLLVACLAAGAALAQAYPSKPLRMVVPFPPGGSADILGRSVGQKLGERLGQPVVIDNRPGAGASIGAKAVAEAPADGYTLLLGTVSSHAMSPATNTVGYDPVKDFTPIAEIASIPFVVLVHPGVPVKNIAELVALAKSKPGQLSFASSGNGAGAHLAGGPSHGVHNAAGPHPGDLPNIVVGKDGATTYETFLAGAGKGPWLTAANVFDADGAAVVIHAEPDDYRSQPAGNAGDRIACGVLSKK